MVKEFTLVKIYKINNLRIKLTVFKIPLNIKELKYYIKI